MDRKLVKQYLELLETAKEDPEYQQLCAECAQLDPQVLGLLKRLPEEDRDVLMDYIGILGAISRRLMEISCMYISA